MAMTYKEYSDLGLGSYFDREEEKRAIARNIKDPAQRAAILADFDGKSTYATTTMGGINPSAPTPSLMGYVNGTPYYAPSGGTQPQATPGYNSAPDPSIPSIDFNTGKVTYPSAPANTYAPSRLASQESGAIGAASIASQMPKVKPSKFAQAAQPKPYRVQGGDTLSSIAKKNNMSLSQLMKLNPKFQQQAKYKGGQTIFRNTAVNLTPKKPVVKKTGAFSGMNTTSPGQFRMAEERSKQQATPTLKNPLGGM